MDAAMAEASKYSNGYCLATGDILLTKQSRGFATGTQQHKDETDGVNDEQLLLCERNATISLRFVLVDDNGKATIGQNLRLCKANIGIEIEGF